MYCVANGGRWGAEKKAFLCAFYMDEPLCCAVCLLIFPDGYSFNYGYNGGRNRDRTDRMDYNANADRRGYVRKVVA